MPRERPIQFRPGDLAAALDARCNGTPGDRNVIAKRDLERYYALLDRERIGIQLSQEDAYIILISTGTVRQWTPHVIGLLAEIIAHGLRHYPPGTYPCADRLVARLSAMTYAQLAAIVDACERYDWSLRQGWGTSEALAASGLVNRDQCETAVPEKEKTP